LSIDTIAARREAELNLWAHAHHAQPDALGRSQATVKLEPSDRIDDWHDAAIEPSKLVARHRGAD
jgi:hypothetical protein